MTLKAISSVQHFRSFGAMLFITSLPIEMDPTVICVPCMLDHVCYQPFSFKKLQMWKVSYANWLNFVYCMKFTSRRPDSSI